MKKNTLRFNSMCIQNVEDFTVNGNSFSFLYGKDSKVISNSNGSLNPWPCNTRVSSNMSYMYEENESFKTL